MAGIYGFALQKNKRLNAPFVLSDNKVKNVFKNEDVELGRSVLNTLKDDRFFQENEDVVICFEGVNLSQNITSKNHFFKAYKEKGLHFLKDLRGTYSGFIYDKIAKKISIFTDNLATRNLFYYHSKETGFVFSSELNALAFF